MGRSGYIALSFVECYNITEYEDKRMKKILYMLMSILLLIGSFILINQLQQKNFTVFNNISADEITFIKEQKQEVEEIGFTALLCNEIRVPFDEATNTFFVPVDMNTEKWESMKFESGQPEIQILFKEDITEEKKKEVIASGKKQELFVYSSESWAEYYVTFTGLPIIDLATNEGFYAAENITGQVVFFDTDFLVHGTQQSEYKGHIRGNTSRMFPKKGYKINLIKTNPENVSELNKLSLFGMRKDDDWILHALYNDDTKIRDRLSMAIWDAMGAKEISEKSYYGPKMTYVEVFADNSYCGLYGLMEPVDAKQLNLSEEDYLYKRKNSGGFNYESFNESEDPYEVINGFEIKEGEMKSDAWKPIAELALLTYSSDEAYNYYISDLVDIDNAARLWLFLQVITGLDHTAKNVFYVAKYENDQYKFYFAPWDLDLTWGCVSVGEVNSVYTAFERDTVDDRIYWETGNRIMELDCNHAVEKMQTMYLEMRNNLLSDENVERIITELDNELRFSGAFTRDKSRWGDSVHAVDTSELIVYAKERLSFLDKALFDFSIFVD